LLLASVSLAFAAGGCGLVRHARARPAPVTPAHRVTPGTITDLVATPCGTANRPRGTCFRLLASYMDQGHAKQLVSRSRYRPAPHAKGDRVDVFVEGDGTAWIDREWHDRLAQRQDEFDRSRNFPGVMGWMLVGCGAFGALLGLGLIFWIDRSE
jgi:hypothetical protein